MFCRWKIVDNARNMFWKLNNSAVVQTDSMQETDYGIMR